MSIKTFWSIPCPNLDNNQCMAGILSIYGMSSRVLASFCLVMVLSDRVADTAYLCSWSLSNLSLMEFQSVRQYWMFISGDILLLLFLFRPAVVTVLWWKCDTSFPHAPTTHIALPALNPSLTASWSVCAEHGTDSHCWLASTMLLALSWTQAVLDQYAPLFSSSL